MHSSTNSFRLWIFYVLACMAAYCFLFDTCVHAAEYTVSIPGAGVLSYTADPSNPGTITGANLSGSQQVYFKSVYGNYASGGIGNIGSILRTSNPQDFTFDGTTSVGTFDWPDLGTPETRSCTVNATARNKGYHSATWQVTPGGPVYNIPGQSTMTQTVNVSAAVGSILDIQCSKEFAYDLPYDPIYVSGLTGSNINVFDRAFTISPNVKQGVYNIRFIFINYSPGPVNVEVKLGGIVLGTIAAKAGPGGSYTQYDVAITVPNDVGSYFEFTSDGHTITGYGTPDPDLLEGILNTFTRAIDLPAGVNAPSTVSTSGGTTTVVPPNPDNPGGTITQGGIPDPKNTSTNPREVLSGGPTNPVQPVVTNPNATADQGGTLDSQSLKEIADNTKKTADNTFDISERFKNAAKNQNDYYSQDPGAVVGTLKQAVTDATAEGATRISNAIGGTGAIGDMRAATTMPDSIPMPGLIVKIPSIGRNSAAATVDFDLNPFTNTTSRTWSIPIAFFVKAVIAGAWLYWTWMYVAGQISNLVDGIYSVPNHLDRPTTNDSGQGIWAQITGSVLKMVVSVPFRLFVATAVIMLIPMVLAFLETNMGTTLSQIVYAVIDKFSTVKRAFSNGDGSDTLYAVLGITFQLVPVFTIWSCLFWRFVVIHGLIMIKPVAYSIVRYVNP